MTPFEIAFNTTAWFETSGNLWGTVAGNFDKQGVSFGPRQNCIGQGSLQPLMRKVMAVNPDGVRTAFGQRYDELKQMLSTFSTADQLKFVIDKWNNKGLDLNSPKDDFLYADVKQAFVNFGKLKETQQIFVDDAKGSLPAVEELSNWFSKVSETPRTLRMYCLAYDIVTQNGGIDADLREALVKSHEILAHERKDIRDFMRVVCFARSAWVYIRGNKPFAEDVIRRKLLIVEGSSKRFRGQPVNLDEMFGISDEIV